MTGGELLCSAQEDVCYEDKSNVHNHSVFSLQKHFLVVTFVVAFCNQQNLFVQRTVFLFGTISDRRMNFTGTYRVVVCYGLFVP